MARLATSLVRLRDQVNAAYPNRSKASDGWIGDAAHAASASDHNPNSQGVVAALDLTNDPAHGFDVHALAERVRVNRHPNLKYIISNSRIAGAWTNWNWVKYTGSNPHSKHAHFSVGNGADGRSTGNYDDGRDWNIKGAAAPQGGGDMAKVDTGLNRIVHSEMEGWPLDEVHSGKYDAQLNASWGGRDLGEMVWEKWNKNAPWRKRRQAALDFYDKYVSTIDELSARPSKAELEAKDAKLAEAAKLVATATAEAEATRLALAAEQANKTEDTKLLDEGKGIFAYLTKLYNRLRGDKS